MACLVFLSLLLVTKLTVGQIPEFDRRRERVEPSIIPKPRFRNDPSSFPEVSLPPGLLPDVFSTNNILPILRNRDFENRIFSGQNSLIKPGPLHSSKNDNQNKIRMTIRRRKERPPSRGRSGIKPNRIPPPILRRERELPISFEALGLLPTGGSIEIPISGSRVRQDRTLNANINRDNFQNVELAPQQTAPPMTVLSSPGPERRFREQGPASNRDPGPLQIGPPQRDQGFRETFGPPQREQGFNVNFSPSQQPRVNPIGDERGVNDIPDVGPVQPQWPIPLARRSMAPISPFIGQQMSFPVNSIQQPFPGTMIQPTMPPIRTFGLVNPPMLNTLAYPGYPVLPFASAAIPIAAQTIIPYLRLADHMDIDTDNIFYTHPYYSTPQVAHFSQVMRTRFGNVPLSPFGRVRRGQFITRRNQLPVQSMSRVFQTTTPIGGLTRMMTTPPSVGSTTLVPPPSAFYFRDDDFFNPFYRPSFYNPYYFRALDTFLSDFNAQANNRTMVNRSDPERIGNSQKNKAERIQISRTVHIHHLKGDDGDSKPKENLLLDKDKSKHKKSLNKPWFYRNMKREYYDYFKRLSM